MSFSYIYILILKKEKCGFWGGGTNPTIFPMKYTTYFPG